jgi:hypothetical protein
MLLKKSYSAASAIRGDIKQASSASLIFNKGLGITIYIIKKY